MKRFYAKVAIGPEQGGFGVLLDDRPVRTPARAALSLPNAALAEAIAAEWAAQPERIDTPTMRLTRLATTVVDLMPARREPTIDEAAGYAGTDLLCYRAAGPAVLVERQAAAWQPWLDWAELQFDARLRVTVGVMPTGQDAAALRALRVPVERLDDWRLVGLHAATTAIGSLVLGLALARGELSADQALDAALLDELFEIEQWGEDAQQTARHARLRADLRAARRFLELLDTRPSRD